MYHDIVTRDDKSSGFQNDSAFQYKVDEEDFEKQVRALHGIDVVFTFDDGGVSFITKAAPILEKYGRQGVFFISTRYIGTSGFLSAEQVKELEARGHVVGSHSHTHPHNLVVMTEREIAQEWQESCKILRGILGHEVACASIPNGYVSKTIYRMAKQADITELYTSVPTTKVSVWEGLTTIGRYVVHCDMTTEEVVSIATDTARQQKMYRRWQVLELAKKVLGGSYDKVKSLFVK